MATLSYVGPAQSNPLDLVHQGYTLGLEAQNLPQATVSALINTGLAPYVPKSYVDAHSALNATQTYVDNAVAGLLPVSSLGIHSGAVPLGVTGRIPAASVNIPSTQRFPSPFISPAAYLSSPVASAAETLLFPISVANPGYAYRLMVTGVLNGWTGANGSYPVVYIHQGSPTGPVVAYGVGIAQTYNAGAMNGFGANGTFTVPTWAGAVDIVVIGAGGGGGHGGGFGNVVAGTGGQAGSFGHGTFTPTPGEVLTVVVGSGGGPSGAGGSSSVTGVGIPQVFGAGGAAGINGGVAGQYGTNGGYAGVLSFGGNNYGAGGGGSGGGGGYESGGAGGYPGGGGGGGNYGLGGGVVGGAGGAGFVWIFVYPTPATPTAGIPLLPVAFNSQAVLSGATTLYVNVLSNTTTAVAVGTFLPGVMVIPVPA